MAAPVTAGELRTRIRFDRKVLIAAEGGGTESKWQERATRMCAIRPLKGGEAMQGQRLTGVQPVLIFARLDVETRQIGSAWRAVEMLNGEPVTYYAVKTAGDMEREGRFITVLAVAGDPNAGGAAD